MWLISDMTTPPPAQMQFFSPSLYPSPTKQQQEAFTTLQCRNPLSTLLPLHNFPFVMPSYTLSEFDALPNAGMDTPPSALGLINEACDPSYGSNMSEWRPNYQPAQPYGASVNRQTHSYTDVSYHGSNWNQPLVPDHHQRYPISYSNSGMSYPAMGTQTTPSVTPSVPAQPSPEFSAMNSLSPPRTPASIALSVGNSPNIQPSRAATNSPHDQTKKGIYTHRQQLQFFREALALPIAGLAGPFVPQQMYKPHTNSDRKRYVEEIELDAPIFFWVSNPNECGISLADALHSRVKRLRDRDVPVFEGRGPSVSIRLEWPGYRQWSRQIPTKDFRSPPGPITLAKLAKNVAKCVQRFIEERHHSRLEDDADPRWRVGLTGNNTVTLDDIILVSMYHVSLGSWQPQLRLKRPFNQPPRV